MVVGPEASSAGGIAAVVETLLSSPLADSFDLVFVSTYRDAPPLRKAVHGALGVARAAWLLATRRVDLAYVHTSSGFSFRRKAAVAFIARALRRPYVVHVHASGFDAYYDDARAWERRLIRTTLRHADLVIALSPTWEARIQAIVRCPSTSIPNPVRIPPTPAGLEGSPAIVVSLGRLGERKGSLTLVRALSLLDGPSDARLVLAGDGDSSEVSKEAERLGVSDRVDLPGWIDAEECTRLLLGAHVFALPSREEGLPVALLEAMAAGLPSVVTPVGGIPDAFVEGRHGYFVAPDDPDALARSLEKLLDDRVASRALGANARKDATERFAIGFVATRLSEALGDVLARRRSKPLRSNSFD
jgi:glycosyltransferase involved in cell wall biosynthesis